MREVFEGRFMELMLDRSTFEDLNGTQVVEPWVAVECLRQMLNEFEATIYQP